LIVAYGRLGTAYLSHLQRKSIASTEWRVIVCDTASLWVLNSLDNRDTRAVNVLFQYFYLRQRFGWQKQDIWLKSWL